MKKLSAFEFADPDAEVHFDHLAFRFIVRRSSHIRFLEIASEIPSLLCAMNAS